ncbi:hypothetical protein JCM3774_005529 [Rhodotorula dairenensis]
MHRIATTPRPWLVIARRGSHSAAVTAARTKTAAYPVAPVAVDDDCIPLRATYSISDYLPSTPASRLSRETVLKLHRLAALAPPQTERDWRQLDDLEELVAVVQAVRDVDTSSLGLEPGAMVDARVRAEPDPVNWSAAASRVLADGPSPAVVTSGRDLLKLAQRTEGAYYVAPMPENVRTRKRSGGTAASDGTLLPSADEL